MRFALVPMARARRMVAWAAWSISVLGGLGCSLDSATSTSPLGRTSIQRGWSSPEAKALTASPGAVSGTWPGSHPLAVGIFSVMMPCRLASGMVGAVPTACTLGAPNRLIATIVPPTTAVARARKSIIRPTWS